MSIRRARPQDTRPFFYYFSKDAKNDKIKQQRRVKIAKNSEKTGTQTASRGAASSLAVFLVLLFLVTLSHAAGVFHARSGFHRANAKSSRRDLAARSAEDRARPPDRFSERPAANRPPDALPLAGFKSCHSPKKEISSGSRGTRGYLV